MFLSKSGLKTAYKKINLYLALAFCIPFVLMLLAFAVQGVHPFGTRMILTVDLYHQYAPFVAELRQKILSGDSLFFSWNIGLGTNFWVIFANYAASPLNLLLLVFPQRLLSDGIALLACLRIGLAGLFFAMLLRDMDYRREDWFLSLFGSMYALCGWMLSYFWNIMWADAVMLLPLVVLGLRYLIRDKKPLLYCISLFLCVWSNYYAAYFVCLFLVIYAPVCYITMNKRLTWQSAWSGAWRFGLFSALSAGAAAVLVYPTWTALQSSSATGDTFPKDISLTQNMFDFFSRFFLASKPNIRDGMANVYSGVIILLFVPLFFLCTKIKLKEKLAYGAILLVLYFSFANRLLNFVWHGFHFPNQIPYREAFLMSFVVLIIAYKVLRNLKSFTLTEITLSGILIIAYIILYEKMGEGTEGSLAIFLTAGFIIVYLIGLRMVALSQKSPKFQQRFLMTILVLELVVAVQATVGMVAMNESFTGWDFFGKKAPEVNQFITDREQSGEGDGFIRAEMYPAFISNETALYHVKGMSVFSSTASENFIVFMKSLGFHNNGINGVRNFGMTKVTASLLGIRYFIDVNGDAAIPTGFAKVDNTGELRIARNDEALSVGYLVPESVLSFTPQNKNNPFLSTNDFISALELPPVYEALPLVAGALTNATATGGAEQSGYTFTIPETDKQTIINVKPTGGTSGAHMYLYVQSKEAPSVVFSNTSTLPGTGETTVTDASAALGDSSSSSIGGITPNPNETITSSSKQDTRTEQIIDLGTYEADMDQNITLTWSKLTSTQVTVICYYVNDTTYGQMIDNLNSSPLKITGYDSTHLDGTVSATRDGVLLLTIPQDEGWSATVDGQSAEIESIGKAIMGLSLKQGNHEISLTYAPKGIGLGLKISLACASLLVIILFLAPYLNKLRIKIKKGRALLILEAEKPADNLSSDDTSSVENFPESDAPVGSANPDNSHKDHTL